MGAQTASPDRGAQPVLLQYVAHAGSVSQTPLVPSSI